MQRAWFQYWMFFNHFSHIYTFIGERMGFEKKFTSTNVFVFIFQFLAKCAILCTRENEKRLKLDLTSKINSTCAVTVWEKSHPWLTNSFTLLAFFLVIFSLPSNTAVGFCFVRVFVKPRKNDQPLPTNTNTNKKPPTSSFYYNL